MVSYYGHHAAKMFICSSLVNADVDALVWWKEYEFRFPETAQITKQYLCILATSAASERQFSAVGHLNTKLHSWLDPDHVHSLIFLYKNLHIESYVKLN